MMSAAPSAHMPGSSLPRLDRTGSNGCGTYTRPPCALIRLITSPSGSTYGIRSVRNSPITSPFGVLISSPTMIRTPRSRSVAVTAADVTLWSVTQTTSRAVCRARSASCSSVSTESPDAAVCRWQSTRTRPAGAREPGTGRSTGIDRDWARSSLASDNNRNVF